MGFFLLHPMAGDSHTFLRFSRKQRRAVIILISLIILVAYIPRIAERLVPPEFPRVELYSLQSLDSLASTRVSRHSEEKYRPVHQNETLPKRFNPFIFDPNTLDERGWLQLGVPPRLARTIRNYIEKGGRFRQASDLFRIHGMDSSLAEKLMPYVSIASNSVRKNFSEKADTGEIIEINRADSTAFLSLPGIGPVLAGRIVSYRKKLGGFMNPGQLNEVYGLKDSTLELFRNRLVADSSLIKRINLNRADIREMAAHPYIRFPMARAIMDYRKSHGDFTSPDQLLNIMTVNREQLEKARPYLTVN